jgi:GNAT superfamily N-acetyltransferase
VSGAPTIRVVSNAELRAGWAPDPAEDPHSVATIDPVKRQALLTNPLLGPDDEAARLLVGLDGRLAGGIDLLAGEAETPDGPVPLFWGSALRVAPEFRGRGLAEHLLRTAGSLRSGHGASAASRMSEPLYSRLGYVDLPLQRHVLVRRTGPVARRWLGTGKLAGAASAAGDLAAGGHRRVLSLAARRTKLELEPHETFPPELEPRLRERAEPFRMHRSAAWIDWALRQRFADEPGRRQAFHVVTRGGEPVAYLLLKARVYSGVTKWQFERLDLASLVDWQIFDPREVGLEQLALLALRAVEAWDVEALEVCVPPRTQARLGRLGFVRAGPQHLLLLGAEGSPLARPEARDPAAWSLRPAEGDHVFS